VENIRAALLREALDRQWLLAGELPVHLKIEDHIDYARYGVDVGQLKLPWRR
jgi:hypothetical protein